MGLGSFGVGGRAQQLLPDWNKVRLGRQTDSKLLQLKMLVFENVLHVLPLSSLSCEHRVSKGTCFGDGRSASCTCSNKLSPKP